MQLGEWHRGQLSGAHHSDMLLVNGQGMELGGMGSALTSVGKTLSLPFYLLKHCGAMDKGSCPVSLGKFLNLA